MWRAANSSTLRPEGYYSQNMFDAMELDDAEYRLKP